MLKEKSSKNESSINGSVVPINALNQATELLRASLLVGDMDTSMTLINLYPHTLQVDSECMNAYCRVLENLVDPAYQLIVENNCCAMGEEEKDDDDKIASSEVIIYDDECFFYPNWKKELPSLTREAIQLGEELYPWLSRLGASLYVSLTLFVKICRLGKSAMESINAAPDQEQATRAKVFWENILRLSILPSLSMIIGSSCECRLLQNTRSIFPRCG